MEANVAEGKGIVERETARIFWDGMPIWGKIRSLSDLFLQNKQVELNQISPRIAAMRKVKPDLPVFIRGDAKTPYEHVARLMSSLESAGIKQISLVTEPQK